MINGSSAVAFIDQRTAGRWHGYEHCRHRGGSIYPMRPEDVPMPQGSGQRRGGGPDAGPRRRYGGFRHGQERRQGEGDPPR